MIVSWRETPFGVVAAVSGRRPITYELQGERAERWKNAVEKDGVDTAVRDLLLSQEGRVA